MKITRLTIIIPFYNEEHFIPVILERVTGVKLLDGIKKEIILVNDASVDGSANAAIEFINNHREQDIILIEHEINQGKGAAIHSGINRATGEVLIIQDADLEYDPNEYNLLLQPIINGIADVVYGSRFAGGKPHRILFFWHSIGNKLLTLLSNLFTNLNLTDMETCYKMFRTEIIQRLNLKEKRFGFEPEVTARISRIPGIRIYEVGISYYGRTYEEGKKIDWKDGFHAIYCIFRYNMFN